MPDRSQYQKEYYLRNKERIKERNAARYETKKEEILEKTNTYYHQNKEKRVVWKQKNKERLTQYFQEHYRKNPDIKKRRNREKRFKEYRITEEQYLHLFEQQGGRCLGCNRHQDELNKKLCVDHCHTTGKVRGLLCTPCNLAVGLVNDDPEVLNNLIKYLESTQIYDKRSLTDKN